MKVKGRRALGVCEEPQVQNLDSHGDLYAGTHQS